MRNQFNFITVKHGVILTVHNYYGTYEFFSNQLVE